MVTPRAGGGDGVSVQQHAYTRTVCDGKGWVFLCFVCFVFVVVVLCVLLILVISVLIVLCDTGIMGMILT